MKVENQVWQGDTIMEELLALAVLLYEGVVETGEYGKRLDELFLANPENEILLYLEWETDIRQAVTYIRTHIDYNALDYERFGRILMGRLKENYEQGSDIRDFARRMYDLWGELPEDIQRREPFFSLCYGDEPLSWGDEKQTREIYEDMLNYYNN